MTDPHTSQQRTGQQHERGDRQGLASGVKLRLTSPQWLARAAAVALCSSSVGFVVLFISILETGGELTLFTRPPLMQIALTLPYLIGIFTLGTTVGALLAWRHRYWSQPVRIHQTILALLGLAFSWQLAILGLIAL